MSTLGTTALDALIARHSIPHVPRHQVMVVNPAVMQAIRKNIPPGTSSPPVDFLGTTRIHEKPDQIADCYAFTDARLAGDYLDGRISEAELAPRIATPAAPSTPEAADTLDQFLARRVAP